MTTIRASGTFYYPRFLISLLMVRVIGPGGMNRDGEQHRRGAIVPEPGVG